MRQMKGRSLKSTLTVWFGTCLILLAIILTAAAVLTQRAQAIQAAENEILATARSQASQIDAEIEVALDTARALANAFSVNLARSSQGERLSREQVHLMLFQTLQKNPNFLGVYTAWEPNAFDGKDQQYANQDCHDASGRFIPYWVRSGNQIVCEALMDYETEGVGDYYLIPKRTQKETILNPYLYPIEGVDVLLTSVIVPIVKDGNFYGMAGVDFRVDYLQSLIQQSLQGRENLALILLSMGRSWAIRCIRNGLGNLMVNFRQITTSMRRAMYWRGLRRLSKKMLNILLMLPFVSALLLLHGQ